MLPLIEPLPPARPEIAEATPTACGCAHHGRSVPSSPMPESMETLRSASERSRLLAEASQARRRLNQCRDWASVVAGAARDAVHFNVVDAGQPYASVHRSLPPFYYDPDAHEPHPLSTHPHSCCTSPRSPVRELLAAPSPSPRDVKPFVRPVKTEPHAHSHSHHVPHAPPSPSRETFHHYRHRPTVPEYAYARVEVLDEKPLRLNVEPHLELSALRKRRRSPQTHVSAAASPVPPAQRVKVEPTSPVLPPKRRTSSVPVSSFSPNAHASSSRRPASLRDRRTDRSARLPSLVNAGTSVREPVAGSSRPTAPGIQRRRSHSSASPPLGHRQSLGEANVPLHSSSPPQGSGLGLHQPAQTEPESQAMISMLSTQSAPAAPDSNSGDEHRAPDQDSPKRICDPLPSIGGLWCARDSNPRSRSRQSTPKPKGKLRGPMI